MTRSTTARRRPRDAEVRPDAGDVERATAWRDWRGSRRADPHDRGKIATNRLHARPTDEIVDADCAVEAEAEHDQTDSTIAHAAP